MLVHEAALNTFILYPVKIGSDLRELLFADADLEKDLVELYSRAHIDCAKNRDHDNHKFFEGLLGEGQVHDVALTAWIKRRETPETSHISRVTF